MYGYMVRNAKKFGILTTVNSWVFLMRENHGKLYITRPMDCGARDPPFTILQALYYMSALTAMHGQLIETDENGKPATIPLANTKYPHPAPHVSGQSPQSLQPSGQATFIYPLPTSQYFLDNSGYGHHILLEPWNENNHIGQKSFRARLVPENLAVVVKLWDGCKSSGKERDLEVEIYMRLQSLWRVHIPQLICSADIDFCYSIILEDVKAIPPHV